MTVVTFYQSHEAASLFVEEPKPASKTLPEWYKTQSGSLGEFGSTIKRCMPVFDAMTAGYILSLPCDIYVDATNPEKLTYFIPPDGLENLQEDLFYEHHPMQLSNYPRNKAHHKQVLRIDPFYAVGTKKGYSCMFVQPTHQDSTPLQLFPAVVDTDSFIAHGFYSFYVEAGFRGIIKQGTPLVQVIPFKRESFSSKIVGFESAKTLLRNQGAKLRSTFLGGYKNKFRELKKYK
jgi:hypothetical protein